MDSGGCDTFLARPCGPVTITLKATSARLGSTGAEAISDGVDVLGCTCPIAPGGAPTALLVTLNTIPSASKVERPPAPPVPPEPSDPPPVPEPSWAANGAFRS